MLKYFDFAVTLGEFPDEIALCLNISNCPGCCEGCSESYLLEDIGTILNEKEIDRLIELNPDITLFGFMGGDSDHDEVHKLSKYIHDKYSIKVGMYSGKDYLDLNLVDELDYYKIGRFILPKPSNQPED